MNPEVWPEFCGKHEAERISVQLEDIEGRVFPIEGWVRAQFAPVAQAFMENFELGAELGAAVALKIDGVPMLELWGGWTDTTRSTPWQRDTLVCTMSVTKAMAACCLHLLIDRGAVALDQPISSVWPEFGCNGKEGALVRHALDHRCGLPTISPAYPELNFLDPPAMVQALAAAKPIWEPGAVAGYHVLTMGYLVGEIVRRLTGKTIGQFFRDEIAIPFGLDFHIGLNDTEIGRCATYEKTSSGGTIFDKDGGKETILSHVFDQMPPGEDFNSEEFRKAELGSASGHGTASAVAGFYDSLVRRDGGARILSDAYLPVVTGEQWHTTEAVLGREYHGGLGFLRNSPPFVFMGPNPDAFGHHGVGGAIGFGDPVTGVAFCYLPNRMHVRLDNGPRAGRLIRGVYQQLSAINA